MKSEDKEVLLKWYCSRILVFVDGSLQSGLSILYSISPHSSLRSGSSPYLIGILSNSLALEIISIRCFSFDSSLMFSANSQMVWLEIQKKLEILPKLSGRSSYSPSTAIHFISTSSSIVDSINSERQSLIAVADMSWSLQKLGF